MLDMEKSWKVKHEAVILIREAVWYTTNFGSYIDQCNCDFVNEEMGILNRKGGKFLNKLYINNVEFREKIINFVKDKKELDLDLILDKRCKTNTLNTLGNKYLAECITSKDYTKDLIEIMLNIICKAVSLIHKVCTPILQHS